MPTSSPHINKSVHAGTPPAAISVSDLTVTYDGIPALEEISFELPIGTVAAIIGPNGSGKTTLIKAILGIIKPVQGTVRILGQHIHDVRAAIGYVPQRFSFDRSFPITVREFMELNRHAHASREHMLEKLSEAGLQDDILPHRLGTLSGGQLQRVLIAQATLNNPALLVLDEPATGIDVVGEAAFYDIIRTLNRKHQTTVLLVSHDISMVQATVDEVICVNKRLMCFGPPKSAMTTKTLKELFGDHAHPYGHDHHHTAHKHEHAS